MRHAWVLLALFIAAAAAWAGDGVPPERLERLARGINLAHWLWLPHAKTEADRNAWLTDADARTLRALGLTHVRLPFEPERLWDRTTRTIREDGWRELDRAIVRCVAADLAVVVDAHPIAADWTRPEPDSGRFTDLEALWPPLATRLAATNPDLVFLEILNEPHDVEAPVWAAAQERLITAIRAAAPRHTIIATGDDWGGIDGLLRAKPLADPNVVYSFHFYEPHDFTHQGATWGAPFWRHLKNLPYPSSREALEQPAAAITDPQAASAARRYGREQWNAQRIADRIGKAAAWGRKHHVPVYCGEFGAFRDFSPRESRLAWIRDAAAALRDSKLGWAMWDYAGGFALMEGNPGSRRPDADVARALGLAPP